MRLTLPMRARLHLPPFDRGTVEQWLHLCVTVARRPSTVALFSALVAIEKDLGGSVAQLVVRIGLFVWHSQGSLSQLGRPGKPCSKQPISV